MLKMDLSNVFSLYVENTRNNGLGHLISRVLYIQMMKWAEQLPKNSNPNAENIHDVQRGLRVFLRILIS